MEIVAVVCGKIFGNICGKICGEIDKFVRLEKKIGVVVDIDSPIMIVVCGKMCGKICGKNVC